MIFHSLVSCGVADSPRCCIRLCDGTATVFVMKKVKLSKNSFDIIFMMAMTFAAYSAPILLGGNGYLSVYIAGIIIGNSKYRGE